VSFPRYESYKDSGVEWLDGVPEHWEVTRLKTLVAEVDERVEGRNFELLGLSKAQGVVKRSQLEQGASEADDYAKYKVAITGQLVMNKMQAWNGVFGLCPIPGMVSPDYAVFRFLKSDLAEFLCALFRTELMAGAFFTRSRGMGTAFLRLNTPDFLDIKVPLPPSEEARSIAAFLDVETMKIDVLVDEQRRLVELLKEKRQAVIAQAVTKGLNPHASMKDSGIDWLGKVPEGWGVRKLSQLFRAGKGKNGQLLTKEYCAMHEGEYPVYSGQTENDGVMATLNEFEFDFGSNGVLFSTTVGAKAMHLKQLYGRFNLSQNCMIIWPTFDDCEMRFFYYHLQPLFQFQRGMIPEHMQASFRIEDLYGYLIAVPPASEQRSIANFLDRETAKIDELDDGANRTIALLQERRTALISAAVTGKIDVRSLSGDSIGRSDWEAQRNLEVETLVVAE
jgi:type I restriction enzyme S subunit